MFRTRMALFLLLFALIAVAPSFAQQTPKSSAATAQIAGRWKLVSLDAVRPNGEVVREWGSNPTGYLTYDASGFVSVQIVRDPRPATSSRESTSDERREAFDTYYAYFGTFEINDEEGVVIHHIEGSPRPYEVGTDLKRSFKLTGNRLELSTAPQQLETGELRVYRLIWERVD